MEVVNCCTFDSLTWDPEECALMGPGGKCSDNSDPQQYVYSRQIYSVSAVGIPAFSLYKMPQRCCYEDFIQPTNLRAN